MCDSYIKSLRLGPTTILLVIVLPAVTRGSLVCSKCGLVKKSGIRSCCARGGAWFKNCGDAVDAIFDHTWAEGIQACISRWAWGD